MTVNVQNTITNIVAFHTNGRKAGCWAAAQQFRATGYMTSANDDYAPLNHEGAQTSDLLLDFLYGVAQ